MRTAPLKRRWRAGWPAGVLPAVMAVVAILILAGPWLAPHDPLTQNLLRALEPPGLLHPLGRDHLGRDVLSRVFAGAPLSVGLAVLSVSGAACIGIAAGLFAAIAGPLARAAIMRLADIMLAFPGFLLALLLAGFMGGGMLPLLIGVQLTQWPQFARMAASIADGELRAQHVEAARLAGFPETTILARHVLPMVLRQTLPLITLGIGGAIMTISSLGFLGLGLQPPTPEWGAMISELAAHASEAPVQLAAPCLALFAVVLALTLAGRALSDRLTEQGMPA